jgi:transcriptional regulator with XRE-family HTH domain
MTLSITQIKGLRLKSGITQVELVELMGNPCGVSTYARYESQGFMPADIRAKATHVFKDLGEDIDKLEDLPMEFKPWQKPVGLRRGGNKSNEQRDEKPVVQEKSDRNTLEQQFIDTAMHVADTLIKKNHDYGDSFFQQYKQFGDVSAVIRLGDKIRRLEKLVTIGADNARVQESIDDVFEDIAGYGILSKVSRDRLKGEA